MEKNKEVVSDKTRRVAVSPNIRRLATVKNARRVIRVSKVVKKSKFLKGRAVMAIAGVGLAAAIGATVWNKTKKK